MGERRQRAEDGEVQHGRGAHGPGEARRAHDVPRGANSRCPLSVRASASPSP